MDVQSWCGHCGQSFRLAEMIDPAFTGRCPRCGRDLAPGYGPITSAAVHDLLAAAEALRGAAARLHDSAPRLHVDVKRLATAISDALGQS